MTKILKPSWFFVLGAALLVGGWSMYHLLAANLGLPKPIALVGAVVFDLSALIFSEYARAAAERAHGAGIPALFMLGCVMTSAYANYSHGVSLGWGRPGGVVLGAIPLLLEALFIAHTRDGKGQQLRDAGLLPARLPRVGLLGIALFPGRSLRAIRGEIGRRLDRIEAGQPLTDTAGVTVHRADVPEQAAVEPVERPAVEQPTGHPAVESGTAYVLVPVEQAAAGTPAGTGRDTLAAVPLAAPAPAGTPGGTERDTVLPEQGPAGTPGGTERDSIERDNALTSGTKSHLRPVRDNGGTTADRVRAMLADGVTDAGTIRDRLTADGVKLPDPSYIRRLIRESRKNESGPGQDSGTGAYL